jgi:hypothetical protein
LFSWMSKNEDRSTDDHTGQRGGNFSRLKPVYFSFAYSLRAAL